MPKINYITHDNQTYSIEVQNGLTVMEGAVQNDIPGIDADCGGGCACATCMIFIPEDWKEKIPTMSDEEESRLDFHEYKEDNSRMARQIPITEEFEGLSIKMPPSQH